MYNISKLIASRVPIVNQILSGTKRILLGIFSCYWLIEW